jgi:hypothetical protein
MVFLRRAALLGIFIAGCGNDHAVTDDNALLPGWDLPPAPDPSEGMRVISPVVKNIAPGSEHEMCTWTGIKIENTTDIRSAMGYQKIAGHHILLFATKINQPAGTQRECTDQDMANWRQIVGTGAEGEVADAPGNLVFRVDSGYYLAIQHHYINSTDNTVDSQAVLDLIYAPPGGTYIPSRSMAILDTSIDLPPGPDTAKLHCVVQNDTKAWSTLPHMHEWGKTFNATVTHAGVVTTMVNNLAWDKSYAFHPPMTQYDVNAPFIFHAGDMIDAQCDWFNDTSADLKFGKEMCVFYAQTIDDTGQGNMDCDAGHWDSF